MPGTVSGPTPSTVQTGASATVSQFPTLELVLVDEDAVLSQLPALVADLRNYNTGFTLFAHPAHGPSLTAPGITLVADAQSLDSELDAKKSQGLYMLSAVHAFVPTNPAFAHYRFVSRCVGTPAGTHVCCGASP